MACSLTLDDQAADAVVHGSAAVDAAMRGRRSVRAFTPMLVPRSTWID